MASSTDIMGWAFNGAVYCTDHKPKPASFVEPSPIFLGEVLEGDTCDYCHAKLSD